MQEVCFYATLQHATQECEENTFCSLGSDDRGKKDLSNTVFTYLSLVLHTLLLEEHRRPEQSHFCNRESTYCNVSILKTLTTYHAFSLTHFACVVSAC
jgi:hypothetical protein